MVTVEEMEKLLESDIAVKLCGVDADGIPRGKIVSKAKFLSAVKNGFGFCSILFGWDMHDRNYEPELKISNADNGYQDLLARIDLKSFRRVPWENNIPFFFVSFFDSASNKPLAACPRNLLGGVCDRIEQVVGAKAMAGAELEFYQFSETAESIREKDGVHLKPLTPGMFGYSLQRPTLNQEYFYDVLHTCNKFDVELEGWHTETGPGVFEAAMSYGDAKAMADKSLLFKLVCKSLGPKYNVMPCFMAKPQQGMPGNSGHMHVSLVDKDGNNLFARATEDKDAAWDDIRFLSDIGRHFLAGVLAGLPDVMPLLAPTINSYKRLVENFFAPVTVSWGLENRVASVRLIAPPSAPPKATRLEIRTPGADVHSHYALAAVFALGLYGIENKLELTVPPASNYAEALGQFERLPKSLLEATNRFAAKDSLARKVLGDDFVDHFAGTRYHECRLWDEAVTNWEVTRYVETV